MEFWYHFQLFRPKSLVFLDSLSLTSHAQTANTTHSILKICLKPAHYFSLSPLNHYNSFYLLFSLTPLHFNRTARILLKYKSERCSLLLKTIQWFPCHSEQQSFIVPEKVGSLLLLWMHFLLLYPSHIALESPWCPYCSLLLIALLPNILMVYSIMSLRSLLKGQLILITISTIAYCCVTCHCIFLSCLFFFIVHITIETKQDPP